MRCKRFRWVLSILLVWVGLACRSQTSSSPSPEALKPEDPFPDEKTMLSRLPAQGVFEEDDLNLPFPMGETLVYKIYWGIIPVGESKASTEWVEVEGRKMIVIRFRTISHGVLDKIYPINDTIESLIDPETFRPIRFTKILNEGKYSCNETTIFDHARGIGYWKSNLSDKKKFYPITAETRDLVAFMYGMRAQELKENEENKFQVMADEKLYDLVVRSRKSDRIKLKKYGKVSSLRVEPEAAFNGIFVRKGKMTLWLSKDDRRICTKLEADTPFANVKLLLLDVSGPGDDDWINKKED